IVGKFIMPPDNQLDFIIGKDAKFGGSKCILYGNNITPEQVNTYNKKLHFSGIEILDAIRFNSGNGRKLYESFADSGELKSTKEMNDQVNENSNIINYKHNQKSKIMETQKEFNQEDYLRNQMKYLGFGEGERLHKDLETGINSAEQQFEIKTSSDKASA